MKDQQINFKRSLLGLAVASAMFLSGCGGTGQDEGEANTSRLEASGLTIDGYLARATVFIDSNNNGTRDAWEPFAFTDDDGYYSFNEKTGVDYCASSEAQLLQYCLTTNIDYGEVIVRIDGGYDVSTGEPFLGQLSRRVDFSSGAVSTIITPITSLLSNVTDTERADVLGALEIEEDDLDVDYFNTDPDDQTSGSVDSALLNAAVTIHKTVTVLSDKLEDTYTEIGEEIGTANDTSSQVYTSLANLIAQSRVTDSLVTADDILSDPSNILAALDEAEAAVRDVYVDQGLNLPPDLGSIDNPGDFERVISVASQLPDLIDVLIDPEEEDVTPEQASGSAKALEALVLKVVQDDNDNDSSVENAIEFFTDEDNEELVDALTESLESEDADVAGLAENDFTGDDFDSVEEITDAATFDEDVVPFSQVAGMTFKISDLDLGSATSLDDKEYEFYFSGEEGDLSGSFMACFKYIDDASPDGTLGEGNSEGELVDGFWSLLGATANDTESYSLLITITFLGSTYQGILKPDGMETIDDVEYEKIRFETSDETLSAHSLEGFTMTDSIPSTSQECETRLPSRVGL